MSSESKTNKARKFNKFYTPEEIKEISRTTEWLELSDFYRENVKDVQNEVANLVGQAVDCDDKKVHCIKAPTASGKTESIIRNIAKHKDKSFVIFLKSHKLMKEYKDKLEKREVDCYEYEGRDEERCLDRYKKFELGWKRGLTKVSHICVNCPRRDSCELLSYKKFQKLKTHRVILIAYNMFSLIAEKYRTWRNTDRIFVVDENYFESLKMPTIWKESAVRKFYRALEDLYEDKMPQEFKDLHKQIIGVTDMRDSFKVVGPINPNFELKKRARKKWNRYFEDKYKFGDVCNLLPQFESGVRHRVLITRVYGNDPSFHICFYNEVSNLPEIKNKLIILDATFRRSLKPFLAKILHKDESDIEIHEISKNIKPHSLMVYHYPFTNASTSTHAYNLPKVKKWIDWIFEKKRFGFGKEFCIVCYKRYENAIKKHIEDKKLGKRYGCKLKYFHYGDETGSNLAKDSTTVILIGKFQLPSYVIQGLFLNGNQGLKYESSKSGLKFNDKRLREESDFFTFRASYQGASRARFANHYSVVHILSKEEIKNTWKDVLWENLENYKEIDYNNCPEMKKIFSSSKKLDRILDAAEKLLERQEMCSVKQICEALKRSQMKVAPATVYNHWQTVKDNFKEIAEVRTIEEGRQRTEYLVKKRS